MMLAHNFERNSFLICFVISVSYMAMSPVKLNLPPALLIRFAIWQVPMHTKNNLVTLKCVGAMELFCDVTRMLFLCKLHS